MLDSLTSTVQLIETRRFRAERGWFCETYVEARYAASRDVGVAWNDPAIGVEWPLSPYGAILADKDARLSMLSDFASPFAYDGTPMPVLGDLGQGVGEDGPDK